MRHSVFVVCLALLVSGCGAVKGALKPWVCDCEPRETACADGSAALASREQPIVDAKPAPRKAEDAPDTDGDSAEDDAFDETAPRTVVDPYVDALVTPASPGWPQLRDATGLPDELPASSKVLRGNFDRRGSIEAAMLVPAKTITIQGENRRILSEPIAEDFSVPSIAKNWARPVGAARLVADEVNEILVFGLDKSGEIELVTFSVYKVFGDRIGRVFTTEVGRVGPGGVSKTALVEFVGGRRNVGIRLTPLDASGVPDTQRSETYEWNRWEGMFRVPNPPPTAKPTS